MSDRKCGTCDTGENFPADPESELRPYGPGGALICYRCMIATPESEEQAKRAFMAQLEAAAAVSPEGVAVIGDGHNGPTPFDRSRMSDDG